MLTKTNIKAIRMADKFFFTYAEGQSTLRCIKKGLFDENEPFAQPDVHHDIECASDAYGQPSGHIVIECEGDAVVDTLLHTLKEDDTIRLHWQPLDTSGHRYMLSMQVERKDKHLHYIVAVQPEATALRQAA